MTGQSCDAHSPTPCGLALQLMIRLLFAWSLENEDDAILDFSSAAMFLIFRSIGKFAQVSEIWSAGDNSATQRFMFHRNHGCCIAGMIGPTFNNNMNDTSYDNISADDDDATDGGCL